MLQKHGFKGGLVWHFGLNFDRYFGIFGVGNSFVAFENIEQIFQSFGQPEAKELG